MAKFTAAATSDAEFVAADVPAPAPGPNDEPAGIWDGTPVPNKLGTKPKVEEVVTVKASDLAALLERTAKLEALIEQNIPKFVEAKASKNADRQREYLEQVEGADPQGEPQVRKVLTTARGVPLTKGLIALNSAPEFRVGQTIQIRRSVQPTASWKWIEEERVRPDGKGYVSTRRATKEPRFWGDILDDAGCEGFGQVMEIHFLSDHTAEYKYRCHIPGLSDRAGGDGYWEHELQLVRAS